MQKVTAESESQVVIYVGTHKLAALAGTLSGAEPRIVACSIKKNPSGFEKGFVTSLDKATQSIESIIQSLFPGKETGGISAYVVLGNSKLKSFAFNSSQYFETPKTITAQEIRAVINQTKTVATLPLSECVLQTVPECFLINDLAGIQDPIGLEATRIGVDLKIHTMDYQDFKNIANVFEAAEIDVQGYFPKTLSLSDAVLTDKEKEEGSLILDVADETVQLILWKQGKLLTSRTIANGSRSLTQKIAEEWSIEHHDAEKVKELYGSLDDKLQFHDELIPLVERKGKGAYTIQRSVFHEKFNEMAKNWIQQILGEAEIFAQNERVMYPHYVFTGGGTSLDGFLEFLKKNFSRDAKIGFSHKVEANYELLVDSSMAAALGAYKSIALSKRFEDKMTAGPSGTLQKTLSTAKNWFSNYF